MPDRTTIVVLPASPTSPTQKSIVDILTTCRKIRGYAITRDGSRTFGRDRAGNGYEVIGWLASLSNESRTDVHAIACGPPGTYTIDVIYPAIELRREFMRLPVAEQTVSAAMALGIGVGWPGGRHDAYPVIDIDGKPYRIVDDTAATPLARFGPSRKDGQDRP